MSHYRSHIILAICYLAGLLALLVPFGCRNKPELAFKDAPVILITVDTLRSDHLPIYGYHKVKTPTFDQFAEDAVVFENAFAHSPMTLPSHSTIMTGMLPQHHGVRENLGFLLSGTPQTMAEAFRDAGYQTAAFVSTMVLRPETGIGQGFQSFKGPFEKQENSNVRSFAQQDGKLTLEAAKHWLTQNTANPFFLWVHLYEPHTPYQPPPPFDDQYPNRYDGEIAYTDSLLKDFFEQLRAEGLYEKSIILLTSDHGESLGEHGEKEHGLFAYRPAIQVPFIAKLPQQQLAGSRRNDWIGLADIKATLLGLTGIQTDAEDGMALFGAKSIPQNRAIYNEAMTAELYYGWHAHRGIIREGFHYLQGHEPEIFELATDPGEVSNLASQKSFPKPVREALVRGQSGQMAQTEISEEDKAMLASLGYTGGFDMGGDILNLPKAEFLDLFNRFDEIIALINDAEFGQAESQLVPLLQTYPSIMEARVLLGFVLRKQEKLAQATHVYMEGLAIYPKDVTLLKGLAITQLRQENIEEAKLLALKAANLSPTEVTSDLIPSFFDRTLFDTVKTMVNLVLDVQPNYPFGVFALGRIYNSEQNYPKAVTQLTRAVEVAQEKGDEDTHQRALFWLGDSYARQGQFPPAINLFTQILKHNPDHAGARASLSMVFASQQKPREAIAVLDEWVSQFPTKENYLKAADTMTQIGLKEPAEFYKQAAEKVDQKQP